MYHSLSPISLCLSFFPSLYLYVGTLDKLDIGYDKARLHNPGIIYCSVSGFGQDGPYRDRAALDFISSHYRCIETGDVAGEDIYAAMGQTEAGRYLIVFFVYKTTGEALVISARDMTRKERRAYGKK